MRHCPPIVALFVLTLLPASAAVAAEVAATSRIDAVTVFPQGAEVVRLAAVKLERGDHTVVLSDLPGQLQPGSIRVEGRATSRLDIGAVDHRVVPVATTDAVQAETERRRLDREIERLKDERAVLEALIQAAETQKELVRKLAELPAHPAPVASGAAAAATDWAQIFTLIGARMADAQKTILGAQVQMRDVDRRMSDLEKQRQTTAPKVEQRTEVRIAVAAGEALEGELSVRYVVANAGWQPHYDARLTIGDKASAPKLALARRAAITQRTGEAWDNVALTLSTVRPSAGTAAPTLRPWTIDFVETMPKPAPPVAAAPMARSAQPQSADMGNEVAKATQPGRLRMVQGAVEQAATVEASAFQATFAIKDRVTVPTTGETKRVLADEVVLDPALTVRSVPRVDANAYLYARVTLPKAAPYLAGPVSLFRDRTFVGTGRLPQSTPGEELELGFGADDRVKVRYAVADEKRGETGLISTLKTDHRAYRISIKNGHERPITTTVIDQLPVPGNQDIKVEATGRAPSRRDLDDKRGVIAWDDQLKPDEEKVIEFGYRISWPSGRDLTHRR